MTRQENRRDVITVSEARCDICKELLDRHCTMTNLELAYEFKNKLDATAVSFLGGKIEIHVPHPFEHEFLLMVRDVVGDRVMSVDVDVNECVITVEESEA